MINQLSKKITTYPKLILMVLGISIACLCYFIQYFGIDASEDTLVNKSDAHFIYSKKIKKTYNLDRFLILVYKPHHNIFSNQGLDLIKALKQDLLNQPAVTGITSILDVPLLQVKRTKSIPSTVFPTLLTKGVNRREAEKDIKTSPLYKNTLISDDGQTTTFQIKVSRNYSKHDALTQIRSVMKDYRNTGDLYLGGMDAIADDVMSFIRRDLIIFSGGVLGCMMIILGGVFRRLRWIMLSMGCCLVAVLVMMGLLGMLGWEVTVISSNFISLQIILTLSLVIHLVIKYLELSRQYPDANHRDLVKDTLTQKMLPSLFSVITTIVGFGSLMVSDIYPVSTFGWMMGVGLIVSFCITFLLFGTGLSLLSKCNPLPPTNWVKQLITAIISMISNHSRKVIYISIVILMIGGIGISRLTVENSFINYFAPSTDIHKGLKFIDQNLGGTTPLDIIITLPDSESDTIDDFSAFDLEEDPIDQPKTESFWITQDKVMLAKKAHHYLDKQPEIGKVLSLWTIIQLGAQINGRPLNPFELALLPNLIPESYKPLLLNPYMSIEENQLRLTTRIYDSLPGINRNQLLKRIQKELPTQLNIPVERVKLTGAMVLYNSMLQSLFESQIKSLGVVILAIMAILLILFQNFKLAVAAIIPNLFSVLVILGLMGLLGISLDMMTITIAAITIGIAIDDAIHYIYRFRKEFRINRNYMLAIKNTHQSIGTAIIYTSLIISIGFGILIFSDFIPNVMFGILTAIAMMVALVTSLTLLPSALIILKPFGPCQSTNASHK